MICPSLRLLLQTFLLSHRKHSPSQRSAHRLSTPLHIKLILMWKKEEEISQITLYKRQCLQMSVNSHTLKVCCQSCSQVFSCAWQFNYTDLFFFVAHQSVGSVDAGAAADWISRLWLFDHWRECNFPYFHLTCMLWCVKFSELLQALELAVLASQPLYSVKWSAPHKGLWAGKHVSSPTTLLSCNRTWEKEKQGREGGRGRAHSRFSLSCSGFLRAPARTCTTQMPTLSLPLLCVLFSLTLQLTHLVCTHSYTLFPRSPYTLLQAQLPKVTRDRQCFPLLKSLIESPVALTQHLPWFCVC